ncbi:MFS transporter [Methylococcus sp. EFPC2]|uniref:MFS transporter n=1 Tax=Methylococcus sp. EFPC2 TaxID=2812648 RepID=UPI0019678810|nr:MFS transporter [Methylococcus sp. EFPC2]QSA97786.1 MFS transporter [Methylococcus sp. EFPC2]
MTEKIPAQHRKTLASWALYDIASSTYGAVVPAGLLPLYFTSVVAEGRPDAQALWGGLAGISVLMAGMVAPFAGALADGRRTHAAVLAAFSLLCCLATALLPLAGRGEILQAAALFIVAQVSFTVAIAIYDAYVERLGNLWGGAEKLSSFGWALGFLGGIAALSVAIGMSSPNVSGGQASGLIDSFPWVALLFALLAIPACRGLRRVPAAPVSEAERHPLLRPLETLRAWRSHRRTMRFLLGAYLINDAIVTVLFFTGIYLRDIFGLSVTHLLWLAMAYHVIALPATALFGILAHRTSAGTALLATLGFWVAAIGVMAFGQGLPAAVLVVALLATVMGSTQALLRGMYARLVPPGQAAEFFGFNAFAGRLSAAVGPALFGALSAAAGTPKAGLLSLLLFLVAGAVVLAGVREPESAVGGEPQADSILAEG